MYLKTTQTQLKVIHYWNIWNKVELHLFKKLTTEPINDKGKYSHGKLKKWKERIKTIFHGKDFPYNIVKQQQWQKLNLYKRKVKTIILSYMLKILNTLMQKANKATC